MFFVSFYGEIKGLKSRGVSSWIWKIVAAIALLVSTLAYEVFIPLFCINVLIAGYLIRKITKRNQRSLKSILSRDVIVFQAINLLLLLAVGLFKTSVTVRSVSSSVLSSVLFFSKVILKSFYVSFGTYGLGLPHVISRVIASHLTPILLLLAAIIGVVSFLHLRKITTASQAESRKHATPLALVGLGLVTYLLGFAIFLATNQITVTPTGIGNRTAIAASIGIALTQVGGIVWLSRKFKRPSWSRQAQLFGVSALCATGILINGDIALYWTEAFQEESRILADITTTFPNMEQGSTLIVDGVCPYAGPAIIFESWWDLAGALRLHYLDSSLEADVVTAALEVKPDGLHVSKYWEGMQHIHPYEKLTIYNFQEKTQYEISDENMAAAYFESNSPDFISECHSAEAGIGVPIY